MKKQICSSLLAAVMTVSSVSAACAFAEQQGDASGASTVLYQNGFEKDVADGFSEWYRDDDVPASAEYFGLDDRYYAEGKSALRADADWTRMAMDLDPLLTPDHSYGFQAAVMQDSVWEAEIGLYMDHTDPSGGHQMDLIASEICEKGEWIVLKNPDFLFYAYERDKHSPVAVPYDTSAKLTVVARERVTEIDELGETHVTAGETVGYWLDSVSITSDGRSVPEIDLSGASAPAVSLAGKKQLVQYPVRDDGLPFRVHQNNDYTYIQNGTDGLRDIFGPYFRVGAHVSSAELDPASYQEDTDLKKTQAFYKRHFNSLTCANEMQPEQLIKKTDGTDVTVDLSNAAPILKFAEENGIGVRGHAFIGRSRMPQQMIQGTPEESDLRIEHFIRDTFSQLKADYPALKLYAYDVADAVLEDPDAGNGTVDWAAVYGADNDAWIIRAFQAARAYAPKDCKLFLNENNEWKPEKTADICALAKRIMEAGDYIDGIGLSGTVTTARDGTPTVGEYESALKKLTAIGLDVQITSLYIAGAKDDYSGIRPDTQNAWSDFFGLMMQYSEHISGVTLEQPVKGRGWDVIPGGLFATNRKGLSSYDRITALAGTVTPLPASGAAVTTAGAGQERRGDVNCDGFVDVADAVLVMRYAAEDAEAEITVQGVRNGDVNGSGQTDGEDAVLILRAIAKQITL